MASVWDTNITETLLTAIMLWNEFEIMIAEIEALWLSRIVGHAHHKWIFRIFCNGWMDCRGTFMLFFAYIAV